MKDIFHISQKQIRTTALVLLFSFLSVALLASPQKAYATVPVFDDEANKKLAKLNCMIASLHKKEVGQPPVPPCSTGDTGALDAVAYALARDVMTELTSSLIKWVQTAGVRKGPLWVPDFVEHFRGEFDNASGIFLEGYLDPEISNLICEPFRPPAQNFAKTFLGQTSFADRITCTLESSQSPNFNWEEWYSLLEPQNTLLGTLFMSLDEAGRLQSEAAVRSETEVETTGGGLLAFKECEQTQKGFLINCVITTPGEVVAAAVRKTFEIDVDRLEFVDELNEVVAGSSQELVSWAITGGGTYAGFGGSVGGQFPFDTDGDGVPNTLDACPTVPGTASNNGCPSQLSPDTDGDGVPDTSDFCPTIPGAINGCPPTNDLDNDGVTELCLWNGTFFQEGSFLGGCFCNTNEQCVSGACDPFLQVCTYTTACNVATGKPAGCACTDPAPPAVSTQCASGQCGPESIGLGVGACK